jgi:hypothetical protein
VPRTDLIADGISDELADDRAHFSANIDTDSIAAHLHFANGYEWL